ncbi:MAG TPA: hypothetical protein VGM76_13840 [Lacipirellulaceae bacterium]|jgi:outer membrane murein-binding lipoprotein Lpp
MDQNNKVSLGCGTLILIALIVLLFGNHGGGDLAPQIQQLKSQIQQLQNNVTNLESKIDAQSKEIQALRLDNRASHGDAH